MTYSLYDLMIKHIEDNKVKHNIDYTDSIEYLKTLIKNIEKEYEELKETQNG